MKKITLLFMMLAVSFGYAQTFPLDFSNPADAFGWDPSGGTGGTAQITSEQLEIIGNGNQWDNAFILFVGGDVVDLSDNANNTVTFMMQSTTAPPGEVHTHRIKLGTTAGVWEEDFTTTGQVMETVLINPPNALGDLNELRIFVDSGAATNPNSDNGTYLVDNIDIFVLDPAMDATLSALEVDSSPVTGFSGSTLDYTIGLPPGTVTVPLITTATTTEAGASRVITDATSIPGTATVLVTASDMTTTATYTLNFVVLGPATGAPMAPARTPADVISVFSDEYTNVDPSNGVETFGGTLYDNFTVENPDDTRRITFAAPGSGMQFLYLSNGLDLTDFTNVHMDIFIDGPVTPGQVLTINLINQPGTGDTSLNTNIDINAVGSGTWFSADIALDAFSGAPASRDAVTLIQLVGAGPTTYGPLYFDNLYFHKGTVLSTDDFAKSEFKVYPNPTNNEWNIKTNGQNISSVQVFDILGKNVMTVTPNSSAVKLDATTLPAGLYFARLTSESGTKSVKLIKQ